MADGAFATTAPGYDSADRPSGHGSRRRLPGSPNGAPAAPVTDIDSMRFRSILGRFATGVVAITAIDPADGRPAGLAANSFTSVSLDPPLVAFCVAHTSTTWPRLRRADRQCVNILSRQQLDICVRLAAKGGDKFADLEWTAAPGGSPVLKEALAWIECSVESEVVAGDHTIIVARVHHLDKHHEADPLLFYKGGYGRFDG
ncbi:flavin reductase family protein [Actinomadura alba]|uniref:Flavin reductase family protein n=1 Tax=Actinomadura alba TaxID=406431 RepID=A0ABR7LH10_9ACTN|nr:flavin reductase family protein [Actinomadura alba]MBC6464106.1 flavin reductase family protein [Actinomadura alba]